MMKARPFRTSRLLPAILLLFCSLSLTGFAEGSRIERIEPPNWWVGFKNSNLQLLVHGENISGSTVVVDYPGVTLKKVNRVENPNYLFLDLTVAPGTKPGIATITFKLKDKVIAKQLYEFRSRKKDSAKRATFSSHDVIYLLMPDRFANGDPSNDSKPGMAEQADRANKDGRHGGDLKGVASHLDYLQDLGITALWMNPVTENDQAKYSYHGYSTTDYYKVDPRFGTNAEYLDLIASLHKRGIKIIQDMVFNHCGSGHWWMKDLPTADWINKWPEFTRTNYRAGTFTDPYASQADSTLFVKGWFDRTMPDLNQLNPYLKNYLIQSSIWWIEYADLDGIRQDTHPYPFKKMMAEWGARLQSEYPGFNVVGECWLSFPASVAYWQQGSHNRDGYNSNLPSVFDFPMFDALANAFNETDGWHTGLTRFYEVLAQDFSYPKPENLVVFADNHDVNRYLDSQKEDVRKMKMAMAFLLTVRGIPQIYYGTEVLLGNGPDHEGDGNKRRDFPGGWSGDTHDAFTMTGRTAEENDMYDYVRKLVHWRNVNEVIHNGGFRHFIPDDGIYVYFRFDAKKTVMVMMNNNEGEKRVATARYSEFLKKFKRAHEVITDGTVDDLSAITLPGKSVRIFELE